MKILSNTYGLGDMAQDIIHVGIMITPLSHRQKQRLQNCSGCKKGIARLNKAVPNVNPFAKP